MGDGMTGEVASPRAAVSTALWAAGCKDCRAEQLAGAPKRRKKGDGTFEYSGAWAARQLDRGNSRSDRCERHRREHAQSIRALSVPYIDLEVIGEVADPGNPTGPLGGLGPLPIVHKQSVREVDVSAHAFGMTDSDILAILDGLGDKQVAIVEAGTGTGKSTFMPFRFINPPAGARYRPTAFGPIVVTEPRRAAATGVARFVGEELCHGCDSSKCSRHFGPGFPVGYQVSRDRFWDSACDLIYVTDGTMINWVRDGRLAGIGMVIIDEAHERSENIDIILAQLREAVRLHEHLRVVVTSATLDRDLFISYFGGPDRVHHVSIPPAKSFGYGTPLFVGTQIDDAVIQRGLEIAPGFAFSGWPEEGPPKSATGHPEKLRAMTRHLQSLRCVDEIPVEKWRNQMPQAVARQVVAIAKGTKGGDILAFLPTDAMITSAVEQIRDDLDGEPQEFDVYRLLSSVPADQSRAAIEARAPGARRRVVVSSNLAETSLTVIGVRYVVDSGLICQAEWDPVLASGSFPSPPHSQSGVRQRWGRAGRDAPGWVFPLYTIEQFLALPRNTPPETALTNLETFYMKLISSGLDLDEVPLPTGFISPTAQPDQAGLDYVEQFNRESSRARRALARSGAVDADGHLTAFGREIERFAGEGSHAIAIMLADQLACLHEVALALEVLGEGELFGNDPDCILGVDPDWPPTLRVRVAEIHRGFALGCRDDLDVLLRIVSLWQTRPDRDRWCRRGWVNGAAIERALEAAQEQVDALSAAMKQEVRRPVRPELADRVRAVLSRALVSARFRRVEDELYASEEADGEPPARLPPGLVPNPPERLIAFNRFRRGIARANVVRPAEISHFVELLPWAALDCPGHDDLGMDLLVSASRRLARPDASEALRSAAIFDLAPVGSIVDLDLGTDQEVRHLDVAELPTAPAKWLQGRSAEVRGRKKAFDRDWDTSRTQRGDEPEEETRVRVQKAQAGEENDAGNDGATELVSKEVPVALPALRTQSSWAGEPLPANLRALIAGYREQGNALTLLVEPVGPDAVLDDLERHADLISWQSVDVRVAGMARDHGEAFLRLDRLDGNGVFFIKAWGSGLYFRDSGFGDRLAPGATLKVRAVPTSSGAITATLLPWARSHLAGAPTEIRSKKGQRAKAYPASIVSPPDTRGFAEIELAYADAKTGLSHRFQVHAKDLNWIGIESPIGGERLLVSLEPGRDERRSSLQAWNDRIKQFAKQQPSLDVQGRSIRAKSVDIPFHVVSGLIRAGDGPDWNAAVWRFYEENLHLRVRNVFPFRPSTTLAVPVRLVPLFFRKKAEFEGTLGVSLFVRRTDAELEVAADDDARLKAAVRSLEALLSGPNISARISGGGRGWLLGSNLANWHRLESQPGVSHVLLEDDVVTLVGTSERALDQAMREILRPKAHGILVLPAGMGGRLVGRGGATIKMLREATGCWAKSTGGDEPWMLDAPTAGQIRQFIALAATQVPGAIGRVTDEGGYTRLPDPARPVSSATTAAEAPVDFLTDVDEAEIASLAAREANAAQQPDPARAASGAEATDTPEYEAVDQNEELEAADATEKTEVEPTEEREADALEELEEEEDFAWPPHYLMTVIVHVAADGAEYLLQDDNEGNWRIPSVRLRREESEDAALRRLALSYEMRIARHEYLSERRYEVDAFDVANAPILVRTFFVLVADSSAVATDEWTIWANSQDLARRRVHTDDLKAIAEMKRRVTL